MKLQLNYYLSVLPLAISTNIRSERLSHIVFSIALQAILSAAFLQLFLPGDSLPHLLSIDRMSCIPMICSVCGMCSYFDPPGIHSENIFFDVKNKRINIILYVNATWLGFPSRQMEKERKSQVGLPIWSRATVWFDNRRVRVMNA